jgi:hypothetical protein
MPRTSASCQQTKKLEHLEAYLLSVSTDTSPQHRPRKLVEFACVSCYCMLEVDSFAQQTDDGARRFLVGCRTSMVLYGDEINTITYVRVLDDDYNSTATTPQPW